MRAPLSAITFVVDKIINKKGVSRKIVRSLRPVVCASKLLYMQINNLLDYNLLQKGKFNVNPQKIDIKELIKTITDAMAP